MEVWIFVIIVGGQWFVPYQPGQSEPQKYKSAQRCEAAWKAVIRTGVDWSCMRIDK